MVGNIVGMLMAHELEMFRVKRGLLKRWERPAIPNQKGQQTVQVLMVPEPHNGHAPCVGFPPKLEEFCEKPDLQDS